MLRGELHPSSKLSDEQVLQIRKLWKLGYRNLSVIARNNHVSNANILKIVHRKTWTHLSEFWSIY